MQRQILQWPKIHNIEINFILENIEFIKIIKLMKYNISKEAKSDIEKIKRDGYIPSDFLTEFAVLKKNY